MESHGRHLQCHPTFQIPRRLLSLLKYVRLYLWTAEANAFVAMLIQGRSGLGEVLTWVINTLAILVLLCLVLLVAMRANLIPLPFPTVDLVGKASIVGYFWYKELF